MDKYEGLYDGKPWAELAKKAGFKPQDTETSARRAFEFSAEVIKRLEDYVLELEFELKEEKGDD